MRWCSSSLSSIAQARLKINSFGSFHLIKQNSSKFSIGVLIA